MERNMLQRRVLREFKEVITSAEAKKAGLGLQLLDPADMTQFLAEVRGPPDSPYENGVYTLTVEIPEGYPFKPPKMRFMTRVWHPNISSATGAICLDILKDEWSASMTMRTILLSIQALLQSPEPNDPQDAVVAKQYISDRQQFIETARFWAQEYADAPGVKDAQMVERVMMLQEMGIQRPDALSALSSYGWDITRATEYLFT